MFIKFGFHFEISVMGEIKQVIGLLSLLVILASCQPSSKPMENDQVLDEKVTTTAKEDLPIILFFGNSITAGYGLEINQAFPALLQTKMDTLGYTYKVINAGLSGETTAAGLNRIDWVLKTIPDIFVLELGANDGLRGLQLTESYNNLEGIILKVQAANPKVKIILAGMQVPPNLGKTYTEEFKSIFFRLSEKHELPLVPFILDGVAGEPELNQSDGIHPTEKGHFIVAENVWRVLEPLLVKKGSI